MNYISLDNLTRYHSKFKDYANDKYTLARDYGWKQTEKAGAVTCWPVGESRMKPVVEFLFKETLPEGTKGSGNPSVIEGVESIKVTRCGKNILAPKSSETTTSKNVSITSNGDGSYTFNSPNDASTGQVFYQLPRFGENWFQQGISFTFSCETESQSTAWQMWVANSAYGGGYLGRSPSVITPTKTLVSGTAIYIPSNVTLDNVTLRPQIELGSVKTSFEQGVGNAYTIPLGSTFYGGTLDVASGKLTVTHRMVEADSLTLDISNYPAYLPLECTDTFGRTITSTGNILALTGSTGGKIVYKLANPYTVQIDPVAITSLPQVDKYTPRLNTLYTDAENITVKYIKSPIRDEYEKVQAIIANGGTI